MAGLNINGQDVEIPQINTLDIDEAEIVYEYSNLTLDQIDENIGLRPGLIKALMHIAVRRATPDANPDEIKKAIGKVKMTAYVESIISSVLPDEDDALPPPRSTSSSESASSSGPSSETDSERQEPDEPESSGAPRSATSESRLIRSVG